MTPRQEDAASRAGIKNAGWRQAAGLSALMPGNDDDFLERHDRRELFDLDDSARRRKKVCAIEHECADAENRDCDKGADHSMNPEFPAVHKPVLISGRRYHFDPAHHEKVGPGSHIRGLGTLNRAQTPQKPAP
jgi:hypothetical protein